MTLNQVIKRLETLALSHKQVNHFAFGDPIAWLEEGDVNYAACFAECTNVTISKQQKQTIYSFRIWFCDLVHIGKDSRDNEQEVMSDLMSVAEDYVAMLNHTDYQYDWNIGSSYASQFWKEKFKDLVVAVSVDVQIGTEYTSNRCQVPSTSSINNAILTEASDYIVTESGDIITIE